MKEKIILNKNILKNKDESISIIIYQVALYITMLSGYKGIAYYIAFFFVALFFGKIVIRTGGKIPTNKSWNSFMLFLVFYSIFIFLSYLILTIFLF